MARQERKQKPKAERKQEEEQPQPKEQGLTEEQQAELDDLMESIDEALGENASLAQEFVSAFQQKGGQALLPVLVGGTMAAWILSRAPGVV